MAITTVPNPEMIGVAPDGLRVWRFHFRNVETAEYDKKYAVARRCPHVNAELTWFDSAEAALMAHAMKPDIPPGTWIPNEAVEDGLIDLPSGAIPDILSGGWRAPK